MQETCIKEATFNPKVKNYFTLLWVFISGVTIVGIVLIPIVAIIAYIISGKMLQAMSARLLERKLVVKRGIIFVVEKSIPLEKITDIALSQGPLMRIFGLYQLSFETAGQSAQGALVSLIGVNEAAAFREAILKQKDALSEKANTNTQVEASSENKELATDAPHDLAALAKSVKNIEKMMASLVENKTTQ